MRTSLLTSSPLWGRSTRLVSLLCTLAASTAYAQSPCSAVSNGDFETYVQIPQRNVLANMAGGHPNEGQTPTDCVNWESPTEGRPRYLHTQSLNPIYNPFGNQYYGEARPHSGDGVVLLRNQYASPSASYGDVRDYASQPVALTTGRPYYAECWATIAQPAGSPPFNSSASAWIEKRSFGLSFTNGNPAPCVKWSSGCGFEYELPAAPAQVLNPAPITDRWTRVSGTFRSQGETFLTIGLFSGATLLPNGATGYTGTQVNTYVDDVTVFEIPTAVPYTCPINPTTVQLQTNGPLNCTWPGVTFAWTGPNGYSSQGQLNPYVRFYQPGTYILTVGLPDGTSYVSTTEVSEWPCGRPNYRTMAPTLEAYPNPAADQLTIVMAGSDNARATLYDGQGEAVQELSLREGKAQLATHQLRNGLYHLRIVTKEGKTMEQQISIQH